MNQVRRSTTYGIAFVLALACRAPAGESLPIIAPTVAWDQAMPSVAQSAVAQAGSCGGSVSIMHYGREPQIQFTLDLLVLDRDDADSGPLLFDSATLQPLLNTEDLTGPAQPGVRIGLIFLDHDGYDVEFGYLGMDRFGEPQTRSSDNTITFPFFGGIPANPQTSYTARYFSELNSGEVNIRRSWGSRIKLLAGFRFWELNERFNVTSTTGQFSSSIDNDLYGFQIGGDIHLATIRRSTLFTTVKAGAYYNNADVDAEALNGNVPIQFIDDEDDVAFVGDVAIGLLIPMGPSADFRIGYQGLFFDGVGLAPDQSNDYSLFTGSGTLDQTTLFYHGGFLGIDLFF